ncbi:MAG: hypothetical protein KC877_04635 [Candidatus Kaiserbacteria bacterium]|nr:hypothetical protein [Candidatus Kaiserbacteria bacterium]MCB9816698.1 hypothetical protein [Candidatus Nomurabacteria bacterium]
MLAKFLRNFGLLVILGAIATAIGLHFGLVSIAGIREKFNAVTGAMSTYYADPFGWLAAHPWATITILAVPAALAVLVIVRYWLRDLVDDELDKLRMINLENENMSLKADLQAASDGQKQRQADAIAVARDVLKQYTDQAERLNQALYRDLLSTDDPDDSLILQVRDAVLEALLDTSGKLPEGLQEFASTLAEMDEEADKPGDTGAVVTPKTKIPVTFRSRRGGIRERI